MRLHLAGFAVMAAVALVPGAARSDETPTCHATEVEFALDATLELSDTPMGRGNGSYPIGPGKVILRFEGNSVKMTAYSMRESFSVHAHTGPWTTTVVTEASSTASPDACSVIAEGTLEGHTVHWTTPLHGYRTDGTITCSGSFCGQFGAPARGQSPLHVGPAPQTFNDFVFAPDMHSFTMSKTPAVKTESPKQSSAVSASGREVRRACMTPAPCAR